MITPGCEDVLYQEFVEFQYIEVHSPITGSPYKAEDGPLHEYFLTFTKELKKPVIS